ncbi:MAG: hypothetical protein HY658_07115, partial [Actinobacteria bacterium]|nr:hypothetical protein [Actinomycetota bacterium]
IRELGELRSVAWQDEWLDTLRRDRKARVPILQIQGWTDDLFPVTEAVRMYRTLKAIDPRYPIKLYLGDVGHPRARNKSAEVEGVLGVLTSWFDFWLKGVGPRPRFDVTSATTTPGPDFDPSLVITERSLDELWQEAVTVAAEGPFALANQPGQLGGVPADPIVNSFAAALVDPLAPHLVRTAEAPGGPVQVVRPVAEVAPAGQDGLWYLGQGTVTLSGTVAGADVQYDVRVWDRAPDGTVELVDRGTYKLVGAPGAFEVTVPLFGNAWLFPADHELLIEVTNVDHPFLRPNNIGSSTVIDRIEVELPVRLR